MTRLFHAAPSKKLQMIVVRGKQQERSNIKTGAWR